MSLRNCRLLVSICLLAACSSLRPASERPAAADTHRVRNVILMIGDGMGPQQIGLLLAYARQAPDPVLKDRSTAFDRMTRENATLAISMSYAADVLVVDSAASATQLASGKFAGSEMIGTDARGDRVKTIVEIAKERGLAAGLVSDTRITHATPAAFAAHERHRSQEAEIAVDLLEGPADVLLSGGRAYWRSDQRDLLAEAEGRGWTLVSDRHGLAAAKGRVLGLFSDSTMMDGIADRQTASDPARTEPTLREMTVRALELLSANPQGFFLMVEGGQIDSAGHQNDTGRMLHELLKFNAAIEAVLDWMKGRDDTLLVVTADHETGGFGFSYSAKDLPKPRPLAGSVFHGEAFRPDFNFGDPTILSRLYAQRMSYDEIFQRFHARPAAEQRPAALAALVSENTSFPIDEAEAARILRKVPNPFREKGHRYLGEEKVTDLGETSAFFVQQKTAEANALARVVSHRQNVVWATGTHTNTPVLVFTLGPQSVARSFTGILHHTDIGALMIRALPGG